MVVRLAGRQELIVVDSKVSLAAYLEAAESDDDEVRAARMDAAHARHLRDHVDQLAGKAQPGGAVPVAGVRDPVHPGGGGVPGPGARRARPRAAGTARSLARKVHIATPTTLVTMLRTAEYAWRFQIREVQIRAETVRELALMQPDERARQGAEHGPPPVHEKGRVMATPRDTSRAGHGDLSGFRTWGVTPWPALLSECGRPGGRGIQARTGRARSAGAARGAAARRHSGPAARELIEGWGAPARSALARVLPSAVACRPDFPGSGAR